MADFIPESQADFKSESVADMLRNPQPDDGGKDVFIHINAEQ